MKKLLAILLALACVFALAACTATPAKVDTNDTPDTTSTPDITDDADATEDADAANITSSTSEFADLTILDIPLTDEEYAIGFRVGSDLTPAVNAAIVELQSNGTLSALAEKYEVSDLLITETFMPDLDATTSVADFEAVTAAGTLVIGITEYKPMNYYDASGTLVGFDTEFAEAVCEILGITPEFIVINWDTKEIELAGGQIDCIWNGLTVTEPRRENMDFSLSYLRNEQVIVVKNDVADQYPDVASLAGLTVVAEEGSAGESAALEIDGIDYIAVALQSAALLEVKAGTADAAIIDVTTAMAMTK